MPFDGGKSTGKIQLSSSAIPQESEITLFFNMAVHPQSPLLKGSLMIRNQFDFVGILVREWALSVAEKTR
jgi:hypothetical protein